jgi:hypothetical protein
MRSNRPVLTNDSSDLPFNTTYPENQMNRPFAISLLIFGTCGFETTGRGETEEIMNRPILAKLVSKPHSIAFHP